MISMVQNTNHSSKVQTIITKCMQKQEIEIKARSIGISLPPVTTHNRLFKISKSIYLMKTSHFVGSDVSPYERTIPHFGQVFPMIARSERRKCWACRLNNFFRAFQKKGHTVLPVLPLLINMVDYKIPGELMRTIEQTSLHYQVFNFVRYFSKISTST